MSKLGSYFWTIFVAVAMTGVMACEQKAPAPQTAAPAVKQKIAPQETAPAAESKTASAEQSETTAAAGDTEKDKPTSAETSALIEASLKVAGTYDPEGRFDPFEPLFKDEPTETEVVTNKDRRRKRVPQTPLERVALSQLKLSAIMRTPRGNSAIVEDATGKGYVIKKGTYIGLNSGQVVLIDRARVVVEEEIENVLGEYILKNTELKLQKPAGEL